MRMYDLAWSLWVICCLCSFWSCLGPMLMRGKFLWKNASLWSWLYHLLICPFLSCWRCLCSNCGYLACLCLIFSMLWCSLYIWEHMLAFVDLIHALPTRGRKVPNSCSQGEFCIEGRKIGRNAFVQGELASMHLGALFRLNFSCALLPMVSSLFASPWGVSIFWAFYLGCVEPLPLP
jgi:hypothetical protein